MRKYTDTELKDRRNEYIRKAYTPVTIYLHKEKDADVIDVLKEQKNKTRYIAETIREKEGVMTI